MYDSVRCALGATEQAKGSAVCAARRSGHTCVEDDALLLYSIAHALRRAKKQLLTWTLPYAWMLCLRTSSWRVL
jgi:hypothetical protein